MNTLSPLTIVVDQELTAAWNRLYPFEQRSFTEFLRDVLAKETLIYDHADHGRGATPGGNVTDCAGLQGVA